MQNDDWAKGRAKSSTKDAAVSKRRPRPVYALTQWTIERRKRGWYIITTRDRFSEETRRAGRNARS